jgi:hypothetical protein
VPEQSDARLELGKLKDKLRGAVAAAIIDENQLQEIRVR